jgi:hypothetical protein
VALHTAMYIRARRQENDRKFMIGVSEDDLELVQRCGKKLR